MNRHSLKEWAIAVRPWSFPASAMPVAVTLAYMLWKSGEEGTTAGMDWIYGLWALVNIVIFHAAGNTWSDYFDYRKSVDAEDTFGVRTLTGGMFTPDEIIRLSTGLLALALAGGTGLMLLTGLPLLWIGLGGAACSLLYPLLKYNAAGDFVIFAAYAFLPILGTSFVVSGEFCLEALWLAIPVGLITVAILHANNTRDMATDRRAGIRTMAMKAGEKASRFIYYGEILIPFAWVAGCTAAGIFPAWCLLTFMAIFPAAGALKMMAGSRTGGMEAISSLDQATAQLQLVFSLLFAASFIAAYFI